MELHRAGDGALETTVDQALIRGLDTAFRVFVSGLFRCLKGGHRAEPGHVVSSGVPLRARAQRRELQKAPLSALSRGSVLIVAWRRAPMPGANLGALDRHRRN